MMQSREDKEINLARITGLNPRKVRDLDESTFAQLNKLASKREKARDEVVFHVVGGFTEQSIIAYVMRLVFPSDSTRLKLALEETRSAENQINSLLNENVFNSAVDKDYYTTLYTHINSNLAGFGDKSEQVYISKNILPFLEIIKARIDFKSPEQLNKNWDELLKSSVSYPRATEILMRISTINPDRFPAPKVQQVQTNNYYFSFILQVIAKIFSSASPEAQAQQSASISFKPLIDASIENGTTDLRETAKLGYSQAMLTGLETGHWYQACDEIAFYTGKITKADTVKNLSFRSTVNQQKSAIQISGTPHQKMAELYKLIQAKKLEPNLPQHLQEAIQSLEEHLKQFTIPSEEGVSVARHQANSNTLITETRQLAQQLDESSPKNSKFHTTLNEMLNSKLSAANISAQAETLKAIREDTISKAAELGISEQPTSGIQAT